MNVSKLLNEAYSLHQAGRLVEAETIYQKIIAKYPKNFEARSLLGTVCFQRGDYEEAIRQIDVALRVNPNLAFAHDNRVSALVNLQAEAFTNRGNALCGVKRFRDALTSFDKAIALRANYAEAFCGRGISLQELNRWEEALASFDRAISLKPDFAEAYNHRAITLRELTRLDEALASFDRAIALKPDFAEAYNNRGTALHELMRLDEALASFDRAIALKPHNAAAYHNRGVTLRELTRLGEALASCERAIALKPDFPEAYNNRGLALSALTRLGEALASYERAIALKPGYAEAYDNQAKLLTNLMRLDEALASYERAIALKPDFAEAHSNLLFSMNYDGKLTPDHLFEAHQEWNERYGRQASRPVVYANERDAGRRLRIGYLSPDFRSHSVAHFVEPLLKNHNRQAVEVFCYAEVIRPDVVTAHLQSLADHWRVTIGLSDDELADRIRTDAIDILVDLAGHTGRNRLRVFARKPAPVQVTWLGYPNTTGLEAMDYRLVDAVTDPPGECDAWASETLVRLDGGFLCYGGLKGAPAPSAPPCLKSGTITFGSFNNPTKMSSASLDAWASLLARLPTARLLLKGIPFADATARALCLARLRERSVAPERVEMLPWLADAIAHQAAYDRVDIALDPFPYNGTTTTCEALWMGVPVVTLRGDRHAGRVGASLLDQIGLTEFVANSVEEYVGIALALARNGERLEELRHSLRPRVAASRLCDGPAFARKIEAAFRSVWQQWCNDLRRPLRA
jgi:predicted O-linked N-acetylglucosamine transferase (SPINDLY family)